MTRAVVGIVAALTILVVSSPPVARTAPQGQTGASPQLMYVAAGHLWLRPVDGGPARLIATPWPTTNKDGSLVSSFQVSPDRQSVALDDARGRLAVISLTTGRITIILGSRCSRDCSGPTYAWSPNNRYLALAQPVGKGETAVLRIWDSHGGKIRQLLAGLAAYVAYPEWSHDSTRIAVERGRFDTIKSVYPQAVTVDLSGHIVKLGKGLYLSWSPDDRFVGIIRPNFCGANTCDEDELVRSSAGGPRIVLARHSTNLFDNPIWAPQGQGYAFDRWILNASGHPLRSLAGPHERVLSWRPDGSRLALQTYYPYQGTPDVLYLSTPERSRVRLYTDGWNAGCGVCSKDVYSVSWGRSTPFAFSTPTYPTPKNVTVYSQFFLSSTTGRALIRIDIPGSDNINILGFVAGDRTLIIYAGKTIYRYSVPTHHLATITTGVPAGYSIHILDPTVVGTGPRSGGQNEASPLRQSSSALHRVG